MSTNNMFLCRKKNIIVIPPLIWSCIYCCCRYRKREIERQEYLKDVEQEQFIPSDETLSEMLEQSSGSGSGLPLLVTFSLLLFSRNA